MTLSPGWEPGNSLGFLSFQRHDRNNATYRIPLLPLPVYRFSQHPNGSNVIADSRVYSTPQALLGFQPSESDRETTGYRFPATHASSSLPALHGIHPIFFQNSRVLDHGGLPIPAILKKPAPYLLAKVGFHLGIRPILKLCFCLTAPSHVFQFHPKHRTKTLLASPPSRIAHQPPWFPSPF